jgi:hypothetical protein
VNDFLTDLDADALSRAIHAREVSCREVMQAHLARIHRLNPALNAIVSLAPDEVLLAQAELRDADLAPAKAAHGSRGWMHGMPQAIKDAAHATGFPTTFGSPLLKEAVATQDGLMAARMKNAGCIVIGKTNMPELGLGSHTFNHVFGPTRNAWDGAVSAGGSSGGAAVALAAPAAGGRRLRLHGLVAQPRRVEPCVRPAPESGPGAAVAGGGHLGQPIGHRGADGAQHARPGQAARGSGRPRPARAVVDSAGAAGLARR